MAKNGVRGIARILADKHGISLKQAEQFLVVLFDVVNDGLRDSKQVKIKGLGTFKVIDIKERESVNVTNGERIVIEGRSKITFTPDAVMKELVNKPFSQFETVVLNDGVDFSNNATNESLASESSVASNSDASFEEDTIVSDSVMEISGNIKVEETPIEVAFSPEKKEGGHSEQKTIPEPERMEVPMAEPGSGSIEVPMGEPEPESTEVPMIEDSSLADSTEKVEPKELNVKVKDHDGDLAQPVVAVPINEHTSNEPLKVAAISSQDPIADDELIDKEEHNDEIDMEDKNSSIWTKLFGFVIIAALAFGGGYYLGNKFAPTRYVPMGESALVENVDDSITTDVNQINDSLLKAEDARIRQRIDSVTRKNEKRNDSIRIAKKLEEKQQKEQRAMDIMTNQRNEKQDDVNKSELNKRNTQENKNIEKIETPSAENTQLVLKKAKQMTVNGAYNIVGTDQTITVKAGQSMKSIAKFYLGTGMECYIQIHNGVAEVKTGDKLRIPKLQLKKK